MTIEIDHIGLGVSDYEAAKKFYGDALKPLRIEMLMEFTEAMTGHSDTAGFGADGKPFLWIFAGGKTEPHIHLALRAESREQVDAFYAAALAAGAKDNGAPGVRELYHPDYYGAYVLDADGHNIEAVCHVPPMMAASQKPKSARTAERVRVKRVVRKAGASKKAKPARKAASRRKVPARAKKRTR